MLGAINQGDRFPGLEYNILRVVAAFPLDANFKSSGSAVQQALGEDKHPLVKLTRGVLTAVLATCQDGKSFVDQLNRGPKRARGELEEGSDDKAEDNRPDAKRRRGVKQPGCTIDLPDQ